MNQNLRHINCTNRFMFYFLSSIDSIGAETIRRLDAKIDPLCEILNLNETVLRDTIGLSDSQVSGIINQRNRTDEVSEEFAMLEKSDIRFITYHDEDYPLRLKNIKNSPMVLYVNGYLPEDNKPSVSIVGARASTNYGEYVSESFARALANEGVNIISGMAVGIDGAAHRGALDTAAGKTFAVLAGGVNVIYPRENTYLYKAMTCDGRGGAISETTPGVPAISRNFPMRNRIISGLGDIVLLVEARSKSGSLITVEYAAAQGRTVMAVPGRINDPMSKGTNSLISNGVRMANRPADILDELSKITNY